MEIRQRGKKVVVPQEKKEEIWELHKKGHGIGPISKMVGYSRWTVDRVLHEFRGQEFVRRARNGVAPPKPAANAEVPERVSAASVAAALSAGVDAVRKVAESAEQLAKEYEELWEKAERLSQMEEGLDALLAQVRAMRDELNKMRSKLAEAEYRAAEKAMAVHGEGSLVSR